MEMAKKFLIFGLVVSLLSLVDERFLELPQARSLPRKHFVLVHGACQGAWSYYKIVALLKSSGHKATAIDLAGSGIDPQQAKDFRTISHYHQPLMDFMAALPQHEKVILVGHSFGGLALCQAMEEFPDKISVAVFVAASMPGPTLDLAALSKKSTPPPLVDSRFGYDDGPDNPPTSFTSGSLRLVEYYFQLSPTEDWTLATMLVRPLRLFDAEETAKELVFTDRNYGRVNRVYIMTDKDKACEEAFQRFMIENNPPNEVIRILGSDHMVMMSKPNEFTSSLLEIAGKY